MTTRVIVAGAGGKMGREVVKAVAGARDMMLAGAVDPAAVGEDAGQVAGIGRLGIKIAAGIDACADKGQVVIDFTHPDVVRANIRAYIKHDLHMVIGTTGLSSTEVEQFSQQAKEKGLGGIVAPNFALGAVLMMHFAAQAAPYVDSCEIIELHHSQKADAPSGTSLKTAEMIAKARRGECWADEAGRSIESVPGARGGEAHGIRIHSVRLPGLVAHQEVIFGLLGQVLTIRHDSTSRESFMPGVLLAVRSVSQIEGIVYGLEKLLFPES